MSGGATSPAQRGATSPAQRSAKERCATTSWLDGAQHVQALRVINSVRKGYRRVFCLTCWEISHILFSLLIYLVWHSFIHSSFHSSLHSPIHCIHHNALAVLISAVFMDLLKTMGLIISRCQNTALPAAGVAACRVLRWSLGCPSRPDRPA